MLVVSVEEREAPVLDAIGAGACGFLTKEAEPDEIIRAVTAVAAGRTYFSPTVAGYLLREPVRLTEREKEILRLVASGETDRDIADNCSSAYMGCTAIWIGSRQDWSSAPRRSNPLCYRARIRAPFP